MGNQQTKFGKSSTADEVIQGVNLEGKVVLITGGNTGIGRETARVLASAKAMVFITCRDAAKGIEAVNSIKSETGNDDVHHIPLELSSFKSVRACADTFLATGRPLHILINNAGVFMSELKRTEENLEFDIGVNHFGHFLLTQLLMARLMESKPSRVLIVASDANARFPIDYDDINYHANPTKWSSFGAYIRSKTANILHAAAINKRYGDRGVEAYALHPGTVAVTEIARHLNVVLGALFALAYPFTKSIPQGAATSVFCATVSRPIGHPMPPLFMDCAPATPPADACDPASADRLWALSMEITGAPSAE